MKKNPEGSWVAVGIFGAACVGIGWVLAKETQKRAENSGGGGSVPGGFIPGGLLNAGGKLNTAGISKAAGDLVNTVAQQANNWLAIAQEMKIQAENNTLTQAQKDELNLRAKELEQTATDALLVNGMQIKSGL